MLNQTIIVGLVISIAIYAPCGFAKTSFNVKTQSAHHTGKDRNLHSLKDYPLTDADDLEYDSVSKLNIFTRSVNKGEINDVLKSGKHQDNEDKCEMQVDKQSVDTFSYLLWKYKYNYAFLSLRPLNGSGIKLYSSKWILAGNIWIWTFYGKEGGIEFLKWPIEFGIWSMGLLYETVLRIPKVIPVYLNRTKGDCSKLEIGNKDDDEVIAKALANITDEMMKRYNEEMYGPSFFCYTKRMHITTYFLCKHVVCPIEAVKHVCCDYHYNKSTFAREMHCPEHEFYYDTVWWLIPILLSIVLFAYSPILLLYVAHICFDDVPSEISIQTEESQLETSINVDMEAFASSDCNAGTTDQILLEGYDHITFFNTLLRPLIVILGHFKRSKNKVCTLLGRLARIILPVSSLSVIVLQLYIDHMNLFNFVKVSVRAGVLMGFRSMITGYQNSKENFMPLLGGPFVALACYLATASILLLVPDSVCQHLVNGLGQERSRSVRVNQSEMWPLRLSLRTIEMLGSVKHVTKSNGYCKLYKTISAQFFMILNISFWKRVISIQKERWGLVSKQITRPIGVMLFPLYICFCFIELLLAFVLYGLPIMSLLLIVIRAYNSAFTINLRRRPFFTLCSLILKLGTTLFVVYFLFMFCAIFLDATLFIARLCIFTFTAIIVVPRSAYGYLIFYFTVFFYLWECIHDFSLTYRRLFHDTLCVARYLQKSDQYSHQRLIYKVNGRKGIKKALFHFVVEENKPCRRQLFVSCLKVCVVLGLMSISLDLLIKTDKFKELHTIMHVGTALFICAMPQIVKQMCCPKREDKLHQKEFRKDLVNSVLSFTGYFVDEDDSDDDFEAD